MYQVITWRFPFLWWSLCLGTAYSKVKCTMEERQVLLTRHQSNSTQTFIEADGSRQTVETSGVEIKCTHSEQNTPSVVLNGKANIGMNHSVQSKLQTVTFDLVPTGLKEWPFFTRSMMSSSQRSRWIALPIFSSCSRRASSMGRQAATL